MNILLGTGPIVFEDEDLSCWHISLPLQQQVHKYCKSESEIRPKKASTQARFCAVKTDYSCALFCVRVD